MAFSEETKKQALTMAKNKCEKCGKQVTMSTCHAHHKHSVNAGGSDALSNCQILYVACHEATRTYGKS